MVLPMPAVRQDPYRYRLRMFHANQEGTAYEVFFELFFYVGCLSNSFSLLNPAGIQLYMQYSNVESIGIDQAAIASEVTGAFPADCSLQAIILENLGGNVYETDDPLSKHYAAGVSFSFPVTWDCSAYGANECTTGDIKGAPITAGTSN